MTEVWREVLRGDIYFVEAEADGPFGVQRGGRPGIIVSNDTGNRYSEVVEVVYMTTKEKKELPTHVQIMSCERPSTALCEQIHSISKGQIGRFMGSCTEKEMRAVDAAIKVSLGLSEEPEAPCVERTPEEAKEELLFVRVERDIYKREFEKLLKKIMAKRKGETE